MAFVLKRQLEREIQTTVAYRWLLGLKLNDPVPHHSTISWNRRTRFKDTNIFQEIFDEMVFKAINHKMAGGRVLFTDSIHLARLEKVCGNLYVNSPVDWSGRCEDSCGSTGLGRPRRRFSAEEAPRHARGKRSTWSGNQQAFVQAEFLMKNW